MTKIIAELSSNHGGSFSRCLEMIIAAKHCGCWAAKFQYYKPEHLPDFDPKLNFPVPPWWLPEMFKFAKSRDIVLFASVFHRSAFKELAPFGLTFKIASPASTDVGRHEYEWMKLEAPKDSTLFISSDKDHFWEMSGYFYGRNRRMLYCKAGYPATIDIDDVKFMAANAVGFSDHTAGIMSSLAMAAAGAQYIEKHFKLDDNCVDAAFSLNPDEMKTLCELTK